LDSPKLTNEATVSEGRTLFNPTNFKDRRGVEVLRNFDNFISDAAILTGRESNKVLQDLRNETTSITYAVYRKLSVIEKLNFSYKEKEKVVDYLKQNTELLDLIIESYSVIRNHFRFDLLTLKLHFDPDTGDEDYLILTILTGLKATEAIKELDKIDDEWWLNNFHRANDKLSIDLVYR
jgi:hypothetical protein